MGPVKVINKPKKDTTQKDRKLKLWDYIESELIKSENKGQCLVVKMDANPSLEPNLIKNDPNSQSANGKKFKDFLGRNPALTVVNSLDICKGVITRHRKTIHKIEESAIDFCLLNRLMTL